jgi:hypothetical protein
MIASLLLIPVLVLAVKTTGQDYSRNKAGMQKWEYLAVAGPSSSNFTPTGNSRMRKEEGTFGREAFVLEQHLDKLGASGWELVSVSGNPQDPVYYFKRAK